MSLPTALRFARAARALVAACRQLALVAPSFRSPPALSECDRTIRRRPGGVVISVRLRDRPFEAVAADMADGVVVANRLAPARAAEVRRALHAALREADGDLGRPARSAAA